MFGVTLAGEYLSESLSSMGLLRPLKTPLRATSLISAGIALCLVGDVSAQVGSDSTAGPLLELAFLEGAWAGEIDGTIGPATGAREYRFIVHDRFLLMRHDRDPETEAAPEDDVYEEWTVFSFDAEREVIVLREFLLEGFVNTYVCELEAGPTSLMCASEAAEGAGGVSLKLRYEFADRDGFTEVFEIFGPDGALQVRMEGQWRRTSPIF
jgi:hypothetical protein